jgi:CubicO group peptidase (beta-lactamase class C family)
MSMIDRRGFVGALTTAAAVASVARAERAPSAAAGGPGWRHVQALIDKHVEARRIAGAVAALSSAGGAAAYPQGGALGFDSAERVSPDSLFRIYSMSKPVTGMAAMALVDDGRLELEQPVADVLPALKTLRVAVDLTRGLDRRPATASMTMRHLLTHTSGFGYWTPGVGAGFLPEAYRARGITPGNFGVGLSRPGYGPQAKGLTDMIARLAELPLAFEPGTAYLYSLGLDVMGAVVERVTGGSLEAFMRDRLFAPLDMPSTGFRVAPRDASRLTTNYWITPEGLRPYDAAATSVFLQPPVLPSGGGGLVSTPRDFVRFARMLLGGGALGAVRVLRPETARRALSNLLPPGVVHPEGGGIGAGGRVYPNGNFGWGGAAGTIWWNDAAREGFVMFMTQHMPPHPFPLYEQVGAAVDADLAASRPA